MATARQINEMVELRDWLEHHLRGHIKFRGKYEGAPETWVDYTRGLGLRWTKARGQEWIIQFGEVSGDMLCRVNCTSLLGSITRGGPDDVMAKLEAVLKDADHFAVRVWPEFAMEEPGEDDAEDAPLRSRIYFRIYTAKQES